MRSVGRRMCATCRSPASSTSPYLARDPVQGRSAPPVPAEPSRSWKGTVSLTARQRCSTLSATLLDMTRIGIRELRQHASRYLAMVKAGQTVEVSERGRLVAILAPPDAAHRDRERLIASGHLLPAVSPTGRLRAARPVVVQDGATNAEVLEHERGDRL